MYVCMHVCMYVCMYACMYVLQLDDHLIRRDIIRDAITIRLSDKAISVREEAVKLIGTYIIR